MSTSLKHTAEKEAERIRADFWGDALPVDPVLIASKLGIKTLDAHLDADVSGALVKERDRDPVILLNWMDSARRKRFSCAHEIGHFVRRSERLDEYEYVDLRGPNASLGTDPEEVFANSFAAALVMPSKEVLGMRRKGMSEFQIAERLDVSREALNNRLATLGRS